MSKKKIEPTIALGIKAGESGFLGFVNPIEFGTGDAEEVENAINEFRNKPTIALGLTQGGKTILGIQNDISYFKKGDVIDFKYFYLVNYETFVSNKAEILEIDNGYITIRTMGCNDIVSLPFSEIFN